MKKLLSVLLAVMMIIGIIPIASYAAETEVPDGYIGVYNIEDLYCIRYALDKNYILMADIDMTEDTAEGGDWDNGYGWAPIGENGSIPFTGVFDGNGHTIKGMQIRGIKTAFAGLFGYVKGTIQNLTLTDVSIAASTPNVGSLAGYTNNAIIGKIKTYGTISNDTGCTGGIIGYADNTVISKCSNSTEIKSASTLGGIISSLGSSCEISQCYNIADITHTKGYYYTGGIVGEASGNSNKITNCYNTGIISGTSLSSSYSAGGIAGFCNNRDGLTIESCVNKGTVSGFGAGSILGTTSNKYGTIKNCYYLIGTAPSGKCNTTDTATTAVALSATQMKLKAVFGYLDFENTWFIDTSTGINHPQLIANPEAGGVHTHEYSSSKTEPTCTAKGYTTYTCSCGDSYKSDYVDALGHSFGEWAVTTAATCTAKGIETRTCSKCGATETRDISALGHSFGEWKVTKPATCTTKGVETRTCSKCKGSETRDISALGHSFGEWVVTTPATEESKGTETRTCANCNAKETRDIPKLQHTHKYADSVTAPTCTEKGYTTHTCSCGDSYIDTYVNALGHSFGEWKVTTPATCTKEGVETRNCTRCSAYETRAIKKLAHSYNDVVTKPTCTEKGFTTHTCSCGDSYIDTYVNALGHSFGEWMVTVPATCTQKGVETKYCSRCDASETRETELAAHSYSKAVTAPTCTEKGYTTYTCSCGDSYIADYVDAKGHTDGEWKVTKAATYTEEGVKTLYCKDCGKPIRTEIISKLTGKVVSVSINNVEVKYKDGATIKPEIKTEGDIEYTVKFESSNPKIASVDDNGNIKTIHKGTANITCTVTDAAGNVVKDTKTINVKFSFGQWLIWILLFGFLWY